MNEVYYGKKVAATYDLLTCLLNDPALPTLFFILGLSIHVLHPFHSGRTRTYSAQNCCQADSYSLISISKQAHVLRVDSFIIWLSHVMCRKESSGGDSEHHYFSSKM